MIRQLCATVAGLLLSVGSAMAAEPARDLALMQVERDTLLYVRSPSGAETQGRFVRASTAILVLSAANGREVTLPADDVALVWRRGDSLRNGAIIGGLIGLAGGIFGQSRCTDCSGEIAIGVALGVPIWGALGAFVDRQHEGRTLIYKAP